MADDFDFQVLTHIFLDRKECVKTQSEKLLHIVRPEWLGKNVVSKVGQVIKLIIIKDIYI